MSHYYNEFAIKYASNRAFVVKMNDASKKLGDIITTYGKFFIFSLVPLTALNSRILYNRKRLNYSEHFIVSGTLLLGICLIFTFVFMFAFLEFIKVPAVIIDAVRNAAPYFILLYIFYGYFNAFRKDYSLIGFIYRFLLFLLLWFFEIVFLFIVIVELTIGLKSGAHIELTL